MAGLLAFQSYRSRAWWEIEVYVGQQWYLFAAKCWFTSIPTWIFHKYAAVNHRIISSLVSVAKAASRFMFLFSRQMSDAPCYLSCSMVYITMMALKKIQGTLNLLPSNRTYCNVTHFTTQFQHFNVTFFYIWLSASD